MSDKKDDKKGMDLMGLIASARDIKAMNILNDLINENDNLVMKTEINEPVIVTVADLLSVHAESKKFTRFSNSLLYFLDRYLRYMVSNKRKSREEIIRALRSYVVKTEEQNVEGHKVTIR